MILKHYDRLNGLLKFIEFAVLGLSAYYIGVSGQNTNIIIIILLYSVLFIVWLIEVFYNHTQTKNIDLLIKHFYEQNHFDQDADVRITIHKRINERYYSQYIDYYPSGGKRGRKFEIKKGIVKFAFTKSNGEFSENFNSTDEKIDKLIKIYNFRLEEAQQQVRDGELSYYCCPIIVNDKNWGVLYMNSKIVNTFPNQTNLRDSSLSKSVKALIKLIENEID
jgi:hypothetical protein